MHVSCKSLRGLKVDACWLVRAFAVIIFRLGYRKGRMLSDIVCLYPGLRILDMYLKDEWYTPRQIEKYRIAEASIMVRTFFFEGIAEEECLLRGFSATQSFPQLLSLTLANRYMDNRLCVWFRSIFASLVLHDLREHQASIACLFKHQDLQLLKYEYSIWRLLHENDCARMMDSILTKKRLPSALLLNPFMAARSSKDGSWIPRMAIRRSAPKRSGSARDTPTLGEMLIHQ